MSWGALLLAGLGLTLLIEGLAYAIAPDAMKRLWATVRDMSSDDLRRSGLIASVIGLFMIYAVLRLSGAG